MKLFESIKFGFGFFIGFEVAKSINENLKDKYPIIKERIKKAY